MSESLTFYRLFNFGLRTGRAPGLVAVGLLLFACGGGGSARKAGPGPDLGGDAGEAGAIDGMQTEAGASNGGASGSTSSEAGAAGALDSEGGAGGAGEPTATGLHIETSKGDLTSNLTSTLGTAASPVLLAAFQDFADASSTPLTGGTWSSSDPNIATVDEQGIVVATGNYAGTATIKVSAGGLEGTLTVHVSLTAQVLEGSLTTGDLTTLNGGESATGGPSWQYPENQTLFPARMTPPTFQWVKGSDAAFHLTLSRGADITVEVYTTQAEYQPSPAVWLALGSDYTKAFDVKLEAKASLLAATPRRAADARAFRTADAQLSGDVYYFEYAVTPPAFQRLSLPDATAAAPMMSGETSCRSCHTVSRDGSLVAFEFDAPDATNGIITSTGSAAVIPPKTSSLWNFATFDPTSTRLIGAKQGALVAYAVSNGENLGLTNSATNATQPSWSPDGSTVAYIRRANGTEPDHAFTASSLYAMSWDAKGQAFGAPGLLSAGEATTNRASLSAPSWAPDSRYLAIGVGSNNYGPTAMTLELVNAVSKARIALKNAASAGINQTPSFAPRAQGGYYFLAFTSSRPYGHRGTTPQVWVTAIDGSFKDSDDPSHAAFWLPGQDTAGQSIMPQWAPTACNGRSASCTDTSQCCGGLTCTGTAGSKTCQADSCALLSETCVTAQDCCAGADLTCSPDLAGHPVCQPAKP